MKFAYADPPYYKQGVKRYGDKHKNADIWDDKQAHYELIEILMKDFADGWVLSCNPQDLHWLLPAAPTTRVCVWAKTFHQIRQTTTQYAFETVLLYGGRVNNKRKPMVRDWISGVPTRKKGLVGAKPEYFNLWVLDLLNFSVGDELVDLFPGTNGMSNAIEKRRQQWIYEKK